MLFLSANFFGAKPEVGRDLRARRAAGLRLWREKWREIFSHGALSPWVKLERNFVAKRVHSTIISPADGDVGAPSCGRVATVARVGRASRKKHAPMSHDCRAAAGDSRPPAIVARRLEGGCPHPPRGMGATVARVERASRKKHASMSLNCRAARSESEPYPRFAPVRRKYSRHIFPTTKQQKLSRGGVSTLPRNTAEQ